ncbi:RNA polymerase sigma factor [Tautonia sociabilis]|uniref:Sigma-70 family RNA polymerase sigma factor n=1 Tax=Tautonia sociabilis TaxID=2080755 RepID=A0A432MGK4_9BACT|nr:sigma-70 family RNA polymerase sigma factor [Tautonia sociabilis]RUL85903.1 sigma-70 family RNA polymerase sigma factor [Tautonia sociabilis]
MAGAPVGAAMRQVERIFNGAGTVAGLTEAQLLDRFVESLDDAAFEAIVRRHGSAVLAVCRRLLGDPHEAEDAFQATFLVLARKASRLSRSRPLGPWLVGVAYRIASKARVASARRRRREAVAAARRAESILPTDPILVDLGPLLWEELHLLPSKYRDPVVLCWVEGYSHDEAANLLCWPIGTVKGRLHRAKETLRSRLSRRGVGVSAACLSSWYATEAIAASVPAPVLGSTVTSAVAVAGGAAILAGSVPVGAALLARGALRTMVLTKLSITAASVALVGGSLAGGWGLVVPEAGQESSSSAISTIASSSSSEDGAIASTPVDVPRPATSSTEPSQRSTPAARLTETNPALEQVLPVRSSDPQDSPSQSELERLKTQLVRAAVDRLNSRQRAFEAGTISIDHVLDGARALLDARLNLADAAEKRAVTEQYRDDLASLFSSMSEKHRLGTASSDDITEVSLALTEAELMLAQQPAEPFVNSLATPTPTPSSPLVPAVAPPPAHALPDPIAQPLAAASSIASDPFTRPSGPESLPEPSREVGASLGGGLRNVDEEDLGQTPAAVAQRRRSSDPASKAILTALNRPISLPFDQETPLSDLLDYIRQGTVDDELSFGIPIYVDEVALQQADQSLQSPIRMKMEGIPLRTTLWLILRQLDLVYTVIDGVLIISNPDRLHETLLETPIFDGLPDLLDEPAVNFGGARQGSAASGPVPLPVDPSLGSPAPTLVPAQPSLPSTPAQPF